MGRKSKYGYHQKEPSHPPEPSPPIRTNPHRYRMILEFLAHASELTNDEYERHYQTRGPSTWYHDRIEHTSNDPAKLIDLLIHSTIQFPRNRPMQDPAEIMDSIIAKGEFYSRINGHEIRIIDTTRPRIPIRWTGIRSFAT